MAWDGFVGLGKFEDNAFIEVEVANYSRKGFSFREPVGLALTGIGNPVTFSTDDSAKSSEVSALGFFGAKAGGSVVFIYPMPAPTVLNIDNSVTVNPYAVSLNIIDRKTADGLRCPISPAAVAGVPLPE